MEHWDAVERSGHGMGSIVVSEDMELLIEFNADDYVALCSNFLIKR